MRTTARLGAGALARAATYRMLAFTRDASLHDPVTAAFSGFVTAAHTARVRVAGLPSFKEWFLCPRDQGPVACLVAQSGSWRDAEGTQVAGAPEESWASACARDVEPPEMVAPAAPPGDERERRIARGGPGRDRPRTGAGPLRIR